MHRELRQVIQTNNRHPGLAVLAVQDDRKFVTRVFLGLAEGVVEPEGLATLDLEMQAWNVGNNIRRIVTTLKLAAASSLDANGTKWVQAALNMIDRAKLDVDGEYGPATRAAVEKFQRSHGLTVDGWAGVNTNDSLRAALVKAM